MAKINNFNSKGQRHGYWKNHYRHSGHYKNGVWNGYWETIWYKCYYKNGKAFGIKLSQIHNTQYFNKQEKQFGEQLNFYN